MYVTYPFTVACMYTETVSIYDIHCIQYIYTIHVLSDPRFAETIYALYNIGTKFKKA